VRQVRDTFVKDLIANSFNPVRDRFIKGYARFLSPHRLEVAGARISAERIIIATGSSPKVPPAWQPFKNRVLTSDNLFEQPDLPESISECLFITPPSRKHYKEPFTICTAPVI